MRYDGETRLPLKGTVCVTSVRTCESGRRSADSGCNHKPKGTNYIVSSMRPSYMEHSSLAQW